MGLIKKFNLIFSTIFLIGFFSTGYLIYKTEMTQAKDEVVQKAKLMIETAFAARKYTTQELQPFFMKKIDESEDTFFPQVLPFYTAAKIFEELKKKYPQYDYSEVAINPRNPEHLPSDWEVGIIRYYKKNPDAKHMIHSREKDGNEYLYISHPIKVEESCLKCHTDAQTAPKSLVKQYGPSNGMRWKSGELIGAHFVSLPMSVPKQKARKTIFTMLVSITCIFALMFMMLNVLLSKWVVKPLGALSKFTERISLNKGKAEEFPDTSGKEMKNLALSIKRLEISLTKAIERAKARRLG